MKVGDLVMIVSANHSPRRARVERVGRKYLYCVGSRTGFDRATGKGNDGCGHETVMTVEAFERRQLVGRARVELDDAGIVVARRVTDDTLLWIRKQLDALVRPVT